MSKSYKANPKEDPLIKHVKFSIGIGTNGRVIVSTIYSNNTANLYDYFSRGSYHTPFATFISEYCPWLFKYCIVDGKNMLLMINDDIKSKIDYDKELYFSSKLKLL